MELRRDSGLREEMWDRTKHLPTSPRPLLHHLYTPYPQSHPSPSPAIVVPVPHHQHLTQLPPSSFPLDYLPISDHTSFMSHSGRTPMGPPQQDVVMGPPPVPPQVSQSASQQKSKEPDFADKYKKLKRKYFELEEKHKEAMIQLRSSGERNVKWRAERALLLERITELEAIPGVAAATQASGMPFSALPRSLMNDRNQKAFLANLHQAIDEVEREDPELDPHLVSRHVGPAARRRQEAEERERQEEEAREVKRTTRKPRGPQKGKDMGAPLTFAPAPLPGPPTPSVAPQGNPTSSPPILVSSTGTRLRLKPPAPPGGEVPPPPASASVQQHPGGSQHARHRSESLSPVLSPQDEYMPGVHPDTLSPSYPQQHGGTGPAQSPMQMTLRASSTGQRPSDIQRHTKPKRLKAHTVTTRSYSIPTVPRDKRGRPILPLNVGIMTVHNLGEVCMREHFHTERYIFPVGYEVTRRYLSTIDPNAEVVYHCKILDGGDGPKFQITASDLPDKPIVAGTATGAWSVIVRAANHIRNRAHSNSVSGPDFFGLGQNTIKHLIQELPHANQLKDYVWQHFVEGGPLGGRHAAVIPALPDEQDPNGAVPPNGDSVNGHGYLNERGEPEPEPIPVPANAAAAAAAVATPSTRSTMSRSRPNELTIIHMEEDPSLRPRSSSQAQQANVPMKSITFHQEYPNAPPENGHRTRRGSRASNAAYDEYVQPPPQPPPPGGTPMHIDSPTHSRTASRSPVMHRERERDRDRERDDHFSPPMHLPPPVVGSSRSHSTVASPHGHRSPYDSHANGASEQAGYRAGTPPPPVPATFASIMHAYSAPPNASSPPAGESAEYAYANGNGNGRRNGHPAER
ncbi:hypothetical protein PYCCODRAFT_1430603 [Trametes coccinea BRFM310]|uniref:Transforming growth factor beta regulator 1 n=1 Tax=Trametes coccinea (strain BRFM310) TaxID=1353009 RepID=A0A1Y2J1S7_TRAC3|nr:hypothetical protein PYCCODRAFT_1430603 [Trametes coccinea BRFM310]